MRRDLMQQLLEWKESHNRMPLILNGARQVGKTWLLKKFGEAYFKNVAYVDFDRNTLLAQQFEEDIDLDRILMVLQAISGQEITPGETLLILDEIQECPRAITSLKYFCEDMPNLAIVAAGSLLGLTVHSGTGFPVGKVEMLHLYPLTFGEFLDAKNETMLRKVVESGDWQATKALAPKLGGLLREYYYVGGMPAVVSEFITSGSLERVRTIQNYLVAAYENDMTKHLSRAETESTIAAWRSLSHHLSQENKRFIFSHVRQSARARDFKAAITWLEKAGIVLKVDRITKPGIPLTAYADESIFKLFCLDIGLLGAMADLDPKSIMVGNHIFTEFKGALTEQFICQELVGSCGFTPFYWSAPTSSGEIDFIIQSKGKVYPLEVKAEENLRAKSLRLFNEKYPDMHCRRFSLSGYRDQGWMQNIPLWAVGAKNTWL